RGARAIARGARQRSWRAGAAARTGVPALRARQRQRARTRAGPGVEPRTGARLWRHLDARRRRPRDPVPARAAAGAHGGGRVKRELRILLVEDELPIQRGLQDHLARSGFRVEAADTVATAMLALRRPADLVVLDRRLPD